MVDVLIPVPSKASVNTLVYVKKQTYVIAEPNVGFFVLQMQDTRLPPDLPRFCKIRLYLSRNRKGPFRLQHLRQIQQMRLLQVQI